MKDEEHTNDDTVQMTISSYVFVVTKRLLASTAMIKELKKYHRVSCAIEALRIDVLLSSQDSQSHRIGRITLPVRLSPEMCTDLTTISSRFTSK
eukprot:IDg116t1